MSEFKVGDRVEVIDEQIGGKNLFGEFGKVVALGGAYLSAPDLIGIEFDNNILGHDCCGYGKNGHCWWFDRICLKKVEDIEEETKVDTLEQKILTALREEIGVEIGEEFDVYENGEKQWTCKFEEIGFLDEINGKFRESGVWKQIVCRFHRYQFKRKPFIPRLWQEYFYLDIEDLGDESLSVDIEVAAWIGEIGDYGMLAFGNVFRTEEEALRNRDKVLERLKKLRKGEQI